MVYERVVFPLICRASNQDPEIAHEATLHLMRLARYVPGVLPLIYACCRNNNPRLASKLFTADRAVHFHNPVGIAAGFDKNFSVLPALQALGAGFVEGGSITLEAQPGNGPRPRMERIEGESALRNAMGFPGVGSKAAALNQSLAGRLDMKLGVSLGKMKDTPVTEAGREYAQSLLLFSAHDTEYAYQAPNVSSPNTANQRKLQHADHLFDLLRAVNRAADIVALVQDLKSRKPTLPKFSPDIGFDGKVEDWGPVRETLDVLKDAGADGAIFANTTLLHNRPNFECGLPGGYSGPGTFARTLSMIRFAREYMGPDFVLIGVGGIDSADKVFDLLKAGADLIQTYTGFVYKGPSFIRQLLDGILRRLDLLGYKDMEDLRRRRCG